MASLEALLATISGHNTEISGYNDLKALYVNEPGIYASWGSQGVLRARNTPKCGELQ